MTPSAAPDNDTDPDPDRRRRIVDSARDIAERQGWEHVTTRRLAEAIGFTQPVLYQHFPDGKAGISYAVALEGMRELTREMSPSTRLRSDSSRARALVSGYLGFARRHPATYEAMFVLPTSARFAADEPEPELSAAFAVFTDLLHQHRTPPEDVDTTAELIWSTLHGLAGLDRGDRLRLTAHRHRAEALISWIAEGRWA